MKKAYITPLTESNGINFTEGLLQTISKGYIQNPDGSSPGQSRRELISGPAVFQDPAGDVDAARGSVGQGVGHAAAVPDHIEPFVFGLQILVQRHFHVVEFHFHAIEQGIVIGGTLADLIQRIDHFDNAVQDPFGQD